jgi:hypothetical protein
MTKPNLPGLLLSILGALIILTPNWILPVCEGLLELANGRQVPMRCFWTARAEMILGGLAVLAGLLLAFTRSAEARRRLNLQAAFLGLAVILTPLYIIPTCANPDMIATWAPNPPCSCSAA